MALADLGALEGWSVGTDAARVHYDGDGARYSIEYYEPGGVVLYWRVDPDRETAMPVDREDVPGPLRARIREDLDAAGLDPAVEGRRV